MPRAPSAGAADITLHAVERAHLPAPPELTDEQKQDWRALVEPFAPERFGPGHVPVLVQLVCHQGIARKLDEQLSEMRGQTLTATSADGAKHRRVYLQLHRAFIAESHLVATLSTKLRLSHQSSVRKDFAEAAGRNAAPGPVPWEM